MRYPRTLCVWLESTRLRYEKSFIVYISCLRILYGKFVYVCFMCVWSFGRKRERAADIRTRYEYMILLHEFMSIKWRKSCVLCVFMFSFGFFIFSEFIYEMFTSINNLIFKKSWSYKYVSHKCILSSITELLSQRTVMCNLFS